MTGVPEQQVIGFDQYEQLIADAAFHGGLLKKLLILQTRAARCGCRGARTNTKSQESQSGISS
ncbi:MAG: hypothetical protein ACKO3T_25405 [Planctomycetaceae bacterium]